MATKPRSRTGYVMVHLSPEQRAKLEQIREHVEESLGVPVSLSDVIRRWIEREEIPAKKLKKTRKTS